MSSNHLSIDCETLGTDFDAPIVSIGARFFDIKTGKKLEKFYVEISLASMLTPWQRNFRPSADTLSWWMGQGAAARKVFQTKDSEKKTLATALLELGHFIRDKAGTGKLRVWAMGPSQDVTWVEHSVVCGGHGLAQPWPYGAPRDVRTITDLAEDLTIWEWPERKGTHHNALDDADFQAEVISSAYNALKNNPGPIPEAIAEDDEL